MAADREGVIETPEDVAQWLENGGGVGVMLDNDLKCQLDDMGKVENVDGFRCPDFLWMLRAAAWNYPRPILGNENVDEPQGEDLEAYNIAKDTYQHVLPASAKQKQWMPACVKVTVPPESTHKRELVARLLTRLAALRFHHHNRAWLFKILAEEDIPLQYRANEYKNEDKVAWSIVMPSWHLHVAQLFPQWDVHCWDKDSKDPRVETEETYVCSAVYVVLARIVDESFYAFVVKSDPKNSKFKLPGGHVRYGKDGAPFQAAEREWKEEVNPTSSSGFHLEDAAELKDGSVGSCEIRAKCYLGPSNVLNRSRPCTTFVLMWATPTFYERTKRGGDITLPEKHCRVCKCQRATCQCEPPHDAATRMKQFTNDWAFIECTAYQWERLENLSPWLGSQELSDKIQSELRLRT